MYWGVGNDAWLPVLLVGVKPRESVRKPGRTFLTRGKWHFKGHSEIEGGDCPTPPPSEPRNQS